MTSLVFAAGRFEPINQLYIFGDSLSDLGTVFRATGGMYPPQPTYFQGRYSNGRVWVEYLADRLQIKASQVNNFACGGATTGRDATLLCQVCWHRLSRLHKSIHKPYQMHCMYYGQEQTTICTLAAVQLSQLKI